MQGLLAENNQGARKDSEQNSGGELLLYWESHREEMQSQELRRDGIMRRDFMVKLLVWWQDSF